MNKSLLRDDVKKLIKENEENSEFVILDIRTPEEHRQGTLGESINLDFYQEDFFQKLGELDKSKLYLIYCRHGVRSGKTFEMMKKLGFQEFYEMAGGVASYTGKEM